MLGILTLVVAYFIFTEIKVLVSTDTASENDIKLLKTGSLLTELYEAESLSKLALQKKTPKSFTAYAQKIDSIFVTIDSLKLLTNIDYHKNMLDSVQGLLKKKVFNSNELLRLKRKLYVRLVSISCNACNNKPIKDSFPKIPAVQLIYELVQV